MRFTIKKNEMQALKNVVKKDGFIHVASKNRAVVITALKDGVSCKIMLSTNNSTIDTCIPLKSIAVGENMIIDDGYVAVNFNMVQTKKVSTYYNDNKVEPKDWQVSETYTAKEFKNYLNYVRFTKEDHKALNSVYFGKHVVATNGYMMILSNNKMKTKKPYLILAKHLKLIKPILVGSKQMDIEVFKEHVACIANNIALIVPKNCNQFPKYQQVILKNFLAEFNENKTITDEQLSNFSTVTVKAKCNFNEVDCYKIGSSCVSCKSPIIKQAKKFVFKYEKLDYAKYEQVALTHYNKAIEQNELIVYMDGYKEVKEVN